MLMYTHTQWYSHHLIWFDPIVFGYEELFTNLSYFLIPPNVPYFLFWDIPLKGSYLKSLVDNSKNYPYYIRRKVGRTTLVLIDGTYVWLQFLNVLTFKRGHF